MHFVNDAITAMLGALGAALSSKVALKQIAQARATKRFQASVDPIAQDVGVTVWRALSPFIWTKIHQVHWTQHGLLGIAGRGNQVRTTSAS
ncbi:hypothetical protein [Nonomuraea sp. NPDC049480]|uniref:hypothetical protein n=1 Tax=Nonomuraea sp. NPDC049480 TaxID=3364353 RepID=UPI0037964710